MPPLLSRFSPSERTPLEGCWQRSGGFRASWGIRAERRPEPMRSSDARTVVASPLDHSINSRHRSHRRIHSQTLCANYHGVKARWQFSDVRPGRCGHRDPVTQRAGWPIERGKAFSSFFSLFFCFALFNGRAGEANQMLTQPTSPSFSVGHWRTPY